MNNKNISRESIFVFLKFKNQKLFLCFLELNINYQRLSCINLFFLLIKSPNELIGLLYKDLMGKTYYIKCFFRTIRLL